MQPKQRAPRTWDRTTKAQVYRTQIGYRDGKPVVVLSYITNQPKPTRKGKGQAKPWVPFMSDCLAYTA